MKKGRPKTVPVTSGQKSVPRFQPPMVLPNPFTPHVLKINVNPWTQAQRSEIRQSFDHQRVKRGDRRIDIFIRQSAQFLWLFDRTASLDSLAIMKKKLNCLERSAAELLKALSRLQQGDGYKMLSRVGDHLSKWTRLTGSSDAGASENSHEGQMQKLTAESEDPVLGNQKLMLQKLWTYTTVLRLQAHGAQLGFKTLRQYKSRDLRRDMLVSFLFQEWTLIFGKEPSTIRNHEFHRVAASVGRALGITIGARTVATKRWRGYWDYLRPP